MCAAVSSSIPQIQGNLLRGRRLPVSWCPPLSLAPFCSDFFFHLPITSESPASTYVPFLAHLALSQETPLSTRQGLEGILGTRWLGCLLSSSLRGRHQGLLSLEDSESNCSVLQYRQHYAFSTSIFIECWLHFRHCAEYRGDKTLP